MAQPPYPYSDYISSLTWDALGNIVQLGYASDSWPITWHDDGDLYTTYCDGKGFDSGGTEYSLGFASISGALPSTPYVGTNITSSDAVVPGYGDDGRKSSGILSISGTLYLWVRNADGNGKTTELWSSVDDGVNWTTHFTFSEFGYLSFINYGQDYADGGSYVYALSHNGDDAYSPADDFVLLRCLISAGLTTSGNWEVFSGTPASPAWSTTFADRVSVFYHPSNCLRSRCTYNADIDRYLWWQQIPASSGSPPDTRTSGGFGVYDAADPWGPWTTVYYNESWDMGPGEAAEFPTKFMTNSGTTMWLVSSTDDKLTARQANITLTDSPTALDVQPAASSDDAEEDSGGVVALTGSGLDLGQNEYVGIRFQLNIPKDATILQAAVKFKSRGNYSDACTQTIQCEAADDAATFTATGGSLSARPKTSAVTWSDIPAWFTDEYFWSGDFAAAVQEVVNRANWTQNDYIAVYFGGLSGRRSAVSYDASTADAPSLHVSYSTGTTTSATAQLWGEGWLEASATSGVQRFAAAQMHGEGWMEASAGATTLYTVAAELWGEGRLEATPVQMTFVQAAAELYGEGWLEAARAQARNIKPYYSAGVPFVVGKVEY